MTNQPLEDNPYAATNAELVSPLDVAAPIPDGTGPPWEQAGPWAKRFFETLWLSYRHPFLLFRGMRRQGSWWMPLGYLSVSITMVVLTSGLTAFDPQAPRNAAALVWMWIYYFANAPAALLFATITHLLLMVSGPRQLFRATLRGSFYVMGSSLMMGVLGPIGQWLGAAALLIQQVIALKEVHRISELRSICVVLGAFLLQMILYVAVYIAGIALGIFAEPV